MRKNKEIKGSPSWEDLNLSLLSLIFSYLSLHEQLFIPPRVCHAWLSAILDTLFKNSILDLRLIDKLDEEERLRFIYLLRLAINRYDGWVSIYFPCKHIFGYFATVYIAEKTPNVSCVVLPCDTSSRVLPIIYISLLYWKQLKVFHARLCPDKALHMHIIWQLANCCNIRELGFHGKITEKEVLCIVESLSKLRILNLSGSILSSEALLMVLDGKLKYLEELDVSHCLFEDVDGKDMDADMDRLRDFKKELLEKACNFRRLKFMHCLEKPCKLCKDMSWASR